MALVEEVCGGCSGGGKIYENGLETDYQYEKCPECDGFGRITIEEE